MRYKPAPDPARVFDVVISFRDDLKTIALSAKTSHVKGWTDDNTLVAFPTDRIRDITATVQKDTHG